MPIILIQVWTDIWYGCEVDGFNNHHDFGSCWI